ncbi:hypothetical protein [Ulvibacterium sp.]|uniref:hypothetical protein n=1 Tax=Ulvibacterium sp. TaxID=2665914 RepID=UPI003CC68E1C
MNTRPLLYVALILGTLGFSQEPTEDDFYQEEVNKLVKVPLSPEAAAFAQYGNTPVNQYSGIPEISIPLHVIPGREMDIPISLTYDASGIKVEALSSWVGLNWNLNFGGRITRMVNGLPDDYFAGGSYSSISTPGISDKINSYSQNNNRFPDQDAALVYFNFLKDIQMNFTDAEPDYYMLNVPGINETIVVDITDNNTPKVLNNPRIKVEMTTGSGTVKPIESWKITHEDGTIYHFEAKEDTEVVGNDTESSGAINYQYTSSWLLTRIESSNKKDNFVFDYSDSGYWADPQPASSAVTAITKIVPTQNFYRKPNQQFAGSAQYRTSQQFLTRISNNGSTLVTVTLGNRLDVNEALTQTRLESLNFRDYLGQPIRSIYFDNQDYFNLDGLTVSPNGPLPEGKDRMDVRLKLNGFQIKGTDEKTYQAYSFEYDRPDDLPSRDSKGMDKLGYYNGADGADGNPKNSTLYPKYSLGDNTLAGANRDFSPNYARIGLLKKINYPTGGFTEFDFESHDIYKSSSNTATVYFFGLNVNSDTQANPDLFTNGGFCHDPFGVFDPKIKIATFVIEESGEYDISLENNNANSIAYIQYFGSECRIKNGVEVCPENRYTTYCDFHTVAGSALFNSERHGTSLTTHLDSGSYAAIVLLDPGSSGNTDLRISQEVTTTFSSNREVGGIRIAQIRDYADAGSVARIKDYSYRVGGRSTGKVSFEPNLVKTQGFKDIDNNDIAQILRTAGFPKGDAPYVTYGSVTERLLDGNGNSEGHTTYEYYGGLSGTVPRSSPPYENSYFSSLSIGNPQYTKRYNKDNHLVSQTEVQYFEGPEPSVGGATVAKTRGIAVYTDANDSDKVVVLKRRTDPDGTDYVTYDYRNYYCPPSGGRCLVPVLTDPNDLAILNDFSTLRMRLCGAAGTYGGVSLVAETGRFGDLANDPKEVLSAETTEYDSEVEYLPRRIRHTKSNGKTFETTNYYPLDGVVAGSQDLLDKNNRREIVRQDVVRDPDATTPVLISRQSTDFEALSPGIVVPTLIKIGKGSSATTHLEDRVVLDYYADGSLLESQKANGTSTFYLWNNRGQYPLAKIENATRTEIENALGINELEEFRPNTQTLTEAQEQNLRNKIPHAMVTTYEYNLLIGLIKMTDPRGYSTFFEYDALQRLKLAKDQEDHILTDYQYKYATEQ